MPASIPPGLTQEHVLKSIGDLDAGIDHPFGSPTGYELVHGNKRYPPKAVVGLACRYSLGRLPQDRRLGADRTPGNDLSGISVRCVTVNLFGLQIDREFRLKPIDAQRPPQSQLQEPPLGHHFDRLAGIGFE